MKKYCLLVICFLLVISNHSNAQPILGVGQYSYLIGNDTLPAYSSDSIQIWVKNYGTSNFNDFFQVRTSVQDSALTTYHPVDTASSGFLTFIAPGDSVQFMLYPYYDIDSTRYHYDINVIVIWPVASSASTGDSIIFVEVLTLPAGIVEIDLHELINAYPNPSFQDITIGNDSKKRIEEVRIYDTGGRWIGTIKEQNTINIENWKPGVYLLTILLEDRRTLTLRVVKQ